MSTLKVATIQDTSGNNSSTPNQVAQGRAKAWVIFNGSSFGAEDSFNVTSISDGGTGTYTVNTGTVGSSSVCLCSGCIVESSIGGNNTRQTQIKQVSTTRFDITTWNANGNLTDHDQVNVAIFGD
tara:strand:+ start:403 stop:777 length:375 start_codon:yes stop_codon:yes gene_type:complete